MTIHCPCCGSPIKDSKVPLSSLRDLPVSVQQRRILGLLIDRYPHPVDSSHVTDAVYFDDPEGGPEAAINSIRVQVSYLRKALAPVGWTIPRQVTYGQYRLKPLDGTGLRS